MRQVACTAADARAAAAAEAAAEARADLDMAVHHGTGVVLANFRGLVLGCIETKFCKKMCV